MVCAHTPIPSRSMGSVPELSIQPAIRRPHSPASGQSNSICTRRIRCTTATNGRRNALLKVCMDIRIRDFIAEIPVKCLDFDTAPLQAVRINFPERGSWHTPRYLVNRAVVNPSCDSVRSGKAVGEGCDLPCPPIYSKYYSDQYPW